MSFMGKEKGVLKPIQRLYKCNAIDLMMFGLVSGIKRFLPSAQIQDAVEAFITYHDLTETEYPFESALVTYQRMSNYYKERHD